MATRRMVPAFVIAAALGCGGATTTTAATPTPSQPPPTTAPPTNTREKKEPRSVELLDWTFPTEFGGPKRASVLVPRPLPEGTKLPVLVALHGLGETVDPVTGANGWPKSYGLTTAYERMLAPPLTEADFQGLVTPVRLTQINDDLGKRELAGVIVVCPYMPKDIGGGTPMELYAEWIVKRLLPRVRTELPASDVTGIDGVSLGGWTAIRVGMIKPDVFRVVGALQPAIVDNTMIEWTAQMLAQHLHGRPFRFLTSTLDLYRNPLTELDKRLTAKNIPHEFAITEGPHDYPWNKGPGAIEMLLWHDRKLHE